MPVPVSLQEGKNPMQQQVQGLRIPTQTKLTGKPNQEAQEP
jgi:hypothetical protein